MPLNSASTIDGEPPRLLVLSHARAGAQEEAAEVAVVAIAVLGLPVLPHHPRQLCLGGWLEK
jgi:hypothetical protein